MTDRKKLALKSYINTIHEFSMLMSHFLIGNNLPKTSPANAIALEWVFDTGILVNLSIQVIMSPIKTLCTV